MITSNRYKSCDYYQMDAMRTASIPVEDTGAMMTHAVFGMCSETGEVAGIFQKVYQGHDIEGDHLKKELGDVLWMVAEACTAAGFKMSEVMAANIEKLQKRYPEGFDSEHSLHRAEGDV